ncbi:MAG: hypothetical protein QW478_11470 [Candidatus Micrarchaeaceae archaeon]
MEIIAVRRTIEKLLSSNGSSGYRFPFSLRNLNFFIALREGELTFVHYNEIHLQRTPVTDLINNVRNVKDNRQCCHTRESFQSICNKFAHLTKAEEYLQNAPQGKSFGRDAR